MCAAVCLIQRYSAGFISAVLFEKAISLLEWGRAANKADFERTVSFRGVLRPFCATEASYASAA